MTLRYGPKRNPVVLHDVKIVKIVETQSRLFTTCTATITASRVRETK